MNVLAAIVVVIPLLMFTTPLSYILRSEIVYWSLLLASLLFPWIAFEIVQNGLWKYDLMWFLVTMNATIALVLYKLFDRIILKIKGRRLFFFWRGHSLPMEESWLDAVFQVFLMMLPLLWIFIGKAVFQ